MAVTLICLTVPVLAILDTILLLLLTLRLAESIRRTRAAITMQRYVRGWLARLKYERAWRCIIGLQIHARGYLARLEFRRLKDNAKVITNADNDKIVHVCSL